MKRIYCFCGCEFTSIDQLSPYDQMIDGKRIQGRRCPEHYNAEIGGIEYKLNECVVCGKWYEMSKKDQSSIRCISCRGTVPRAYSLAAQAKRKAARKKKRDAKKKAAEQQAYRKALIRRNKVQRVFSVAEAEQKNVNCLPLDRLFRVHLKANVG